MNFQTSPPQITHDIPVIDLAPFLAGASGAADPASWPSIFFQTGGIFHALANNIFFNRFFIFITKLNWQNEFI